MDALARVKALYYIMQSIEGKLGGGEGVEGLYGSITRSGMQKVLDCLSAKCGLASNSHFVDIGAGLGRPILHALVYPGVASGFGIEIDRIKCDKAAAFLRHSVKELKRRAAIEELLVPRIQCSSIEKVATLEPATHAYSFWEGVPTEGKCAFGRLFAQSHTMQSVAVVQRAMRGRHPVDEMEEMGFGPLTLAASFPVSMSDQADQAPNKTTSLGIKQYIGWLPSSGRSFTAYVFNRAQLAELDRPPQSPITPAAVGSRRESLESSDTQVPPELLADARVQIHGAREEANEREEEALGSGPATPAPPAGAGRPRLTHAATPLTAGKSPAAALATTPKSAGISGPARRVPLVAAAHAAAELETVSGAVHASKRPVRQTRLAAASRAAAASAQDGSSETGDAFQTRRAQPKRQPRAPAKTAVQATAASPKKCGVQKTRSPKKNATLEMAGFRSRRALPGAGKAVKGAGNFSSKPGDEAAVIEPKGLGDLRATRARSRLAM